MLFCFHDYALDVDRRELRRSSVPVALEPQVFDLLVYLIQNREHVVSRDNLLDVVWGGRVVSESTLTSHINAVRKAIGDSGEEQRLIRTIARKGFRFVGDVSETRGPDGYAGLDHDEFGSNRSKLINVIDSNTIARDSREKPVSAFSHPALATVDQLSGKTGEIVDLYLRAANAHGQ